MYGRSIYGQQTYGGEHESISAPPVDVEYEIEPPVITNAMQVFPPASIAVHGRPLAEHARSMTIAAGDIRIMRVRRSE